MLARTCCQPTWRTRGFPAPVSLPPANQGLLRFAMPKPSNYRYAVKAAASFHSLHAVQSASRLDPRWAAGMPPLRTRHAPVALNALLPQGGAKRFWSAAASAAALNTLPLRPPHISTTKAVPKGTRTPKALRAANPPYPYPLSQYPRLNRTTFVPSMKKSLPHRSVFIRVHPWFKNLHAPVALRARTQPVRQECRPSAYPLPSLPFLL